MSVAREARTWFLDADDVADMLPTVEVHVTRLLAQPGVDAVGLPPYAPGESVRA